MYHVNALHLQSWYRMCIIPVEEEPMWMEEPCPCGVQVSGALRIWNSASKMATHVFARRESALTHSHFRT